MADEYIDIDLGQATGDKGDTGANGRSAWIKYNTAPQDAGATDTWSTGQNYIGHQTVATTVKPTTGYVWSLFIHPTQTLINNLTTATAYQGALDANQGRILNETKTDRVIIGRDANLVSYTYYVVPLVCLDNTETTAKAYCSGRLYFKRSNGAALFSDRFISVEKLYNTTSPTWSSFVMGSEDFSKPCTFTYGGLKYFGIAITGSAMPNDLIFDGNYIKQPAGTENIFKYISYYNSNTSVIINTEINSSILFLTSGSPTNFNSNILVNGQQVYHPLNPQTTSTTQPRNNNSTAIATTAFVQDAIKEDVLFDSTTLISGGMTFAGNFSQYSRLRIHVINTTYASYTYKGIIEVVIDPTKRQQALFMDVQQGTASNIYAVNITVASNLITVNHVGQIIIANANGSWGFSTSNGITKIEGIY